MLNKKLYLLIIFTLTVLPISNSFALIELGGEYGYSKRVFAEDRGGSVVSRSTGGSVAFYLLNFLALEANYNKSREITTDTPDLTITGSTLVLSMYSNTLTSEAWGLGIRFSLAPRKAAIRPDISIGYAHQAITSDKAYSYTDSLSSTTYGSSSNSKFEQESIFAGFALNFRLTERLKLKASVKTIFKAFEFDQAKDYLKYSVGFTWVI